MSEPLYPDGYRECPVCEGYGWVAVWNDDGIAQRIEECQLCEWEGMIPDDVYFEYMRTGRKSGRQSQ